MEMTLRWFGKDIDTVTLEQIRQIPDVKSVITTLYDISAGEVWSAERIDAMKKTVEDCGLTIAGIESVNIHDSIKIGCAERDKYISNYIETLKNLGESGINLVCYNFMPVFDWTRSELAKPRPDGSTVLAYDSTVVDSIIPEKMFDEMQANSNGFVLPGWEPDRLADVKKLFKMYEGVNAEKLYANLIYFLKAIMPTCDKYGIKMAIHPDDPSWSVFGLPRVITCKDNLVRMLNDVNSEMNGITFCTGSLGSNPDNNLVEIIHALKGRIHFAHLRNIKFTAPGKFEEAAHLSSDGSLDMYAIVKALYDVGFDGVIRPDHGRMIWGEKAMPGYGLYDRALGAAYINGLWESITKGSEK